MPRCRVAVVAVVALVLGLFPDAVLAQRAMTVLDLLNLPSVMDPQRSPDGHQLLYAQAAPDWKADKRVTHVWRVDRDGQNAVQMTDGDEGESGARWSPDGATIALVTRRDGDEAAQIDPLSNTGGEARRLTSHPTSIRSLTWSPDGRVIYFLASYPKTDEQKAREEVKDDVTRSTRTTSSSTCGR